MKKKSAPHLRHPDAPFQALFRQRGLTLVELMVGIAIGLMVVAVAIGTLMVTRSVTGTVSDVGSLQQQASYVFRVLGQQIRPAGGLGLTNNSSGYADGVHLDSSGFDLHEQSLRGIDNPGGRGTDFKLSVGQRSDEELLLGGRQEHLLRNCLGERPSAAHPKVLQSHFRLDGAELKCAGGDPASAQPLVNNVADFQVRYLTGNGADDLKYTNANGVGDKWGKVVAVEVCLVLYGSERMEFPAGNDSYLACPTDQDSAPTQCMTQACVGRTSGAAPVPAERANRLHMSFRNVYQLRSQGAACLASPATCS